MLANRTFFGCRKASGKILLILLAITTLGACEPKKEPLRASSEKAPSTTEVLPKNSATPSVDAMKLSIHGMGLGNKRMEVEYVFAPQFAEGNRSSYLREWVDKKGGKARYLLTLDYDNEDKVIAISGDSLHLNGEPVKFRNEESVLGLPDKVTSLKTSDGSKSELVHFKKYSLSVFFLDGKPLGFFLNREPSEKELLSIASTRTK